MRRAHAPRGPDLRGVWATPLIALACTPAVTLALSHHLGRIPLQILGFVGCAAGLMLASAGSTDMSRAEYLSLIVAGFVLFQFMTNLGPNAQPYLLAGEVFPTHLRGLGAGFAAAMGKVGAVLTAFFFPMPLADWGAQRLLPILAIISLVGAAITWIYRIETRGLDLEQL